MEITSTPQVEDPTKPTIWFIKTSTAWTKFIETGRKHAACATEGLFLGFATLLAPHLGAAGNMRLRLTTMRSPLDICQGY
eukprot:5708830-Amphidinium_carterae.1